MGNVVADLVFLASRQGFAQEVLVLLIVNLQHAGLHTFLPSVSFPNGIVVFAYFACVGVLN